MKCKTCGHPKEKHEPFLLPDDTFTKCPICHYIAKDFDDLFNHIKETCQRGLDRLVNEIKMNPRRTCNRFEPP